MNYWASNYWTSNYWTSNYWQGAGAAPPIPPEEEATQFTNLRWIKRRSKVANIDKDRDVAIAVALMLLGD